MFTYGGPPLPTSTVGTSWPQTPLPQNYYPSNSEVVAILMDITNFPTGGSTVNTNHQYNPQQTAFLNARMVGYTNLPGVGPDLVYRDPWRNPYIITMDLNDDNACKDPLYSLAAVSGQNGQNQNPGLNGLVSPDTSVQDNFRYHGNVMVWSAGPDGKVDSTQPADQGVNKDNIINWQ